MDYARPAELPCKASAEPPARLEVVTTPRFDSVRNRRLMTARGHLSRSIRPRTEIRETAAPTGVSFSVAGKARRVRQQRRGGRVRTGQETSRDVAEAKS